MAAARTGDCPDCPHDVIDGRDASLEAAIDALAFRPDLVARLIGAV